ncbi:hypothetical protein SASPL_115408 [Salvia splendens]|uniref:Uncharacterized protein n=1 Tax=Salvia splendens TaxID=180675 RepID=A0A8X8Y7H9_SALSN|nr:hypothetical protein SASPL_115408 [Salvia splendens]
MACIQLLKPTPSNSQSKIACFYADFSLQKRRIRLRNSGIQNNYRRFRVTCKVEDGDKQSNGLETRQIVIERTWFVDELINRIKCWLSLMNNMKIGLAETQEVDEKETNHPNCLYEEPPESLFTKELRRRGMTPTSLLEEKNKDSVREEIKFREEDGGWGYSRRNGITTGAETNLTGQREKSMALNSEGLEVSLFSIMAEHNGFAEWHSCYVAFSVDPVMFGFSTTVTDPHTLVQYFGAEFVHDGCDNPASPPPYVDPYELLEEERMYKTAPPLN